MPVVLQGCLPHRDRRLRRAHTRYTPNVSGSGAEVGYDYQANAIAYISAHALSGQALNWFDDQTDVPASWLAESGGPGDDIRVITAEGLPIEIQAKHALQRGEEYNNTLRKLIAGLQVDIKLRGVLLVDRHASQIIRGDLKNDIVRLGQGRSDGIKPITEELRIELKLADSSVFARLRIAVVDLDEGSDGISAARALLSRVVSSQDSAAAYCLLGKRGHELTKNRGQDDVVRCAKYLETAVGLATPTSSPAASLVQFARWVRSTNETFYSPALRQRFPIRQAWGEVIPIDQLPDKEAQARGIDGLEIQIKRYQEWKRLVSGRTGDGAIPAEAFVDSQKLSVIVGGPGAGKTTLGRRIAFLTAEDRLPIRVRLPTVAAFLASGRTFASALGEAAVDSSGLSIQDANQVMAAADLLVADGLDECDPRRADVAAGLSAWAASHPRTQIVVMTRPVGHSAALLPGFRHAELSPLGKGDLRQIARWMFDALLADSAAVSPTLARFMEALGDEADERNAASIAARNPLLLSFLVRLFVDGQSINGKRTQLFDKIVELIRVSPPLDRKSPHGTPDRATAWAVAETVGWSCIDRPDRPVAEVYSLVAERLGYDFDALRRAEFALGQWTDHGLMERLSAGSLDAVVFVHLALGEYLAGRFLAQLSPEQLEHEIRKRRRKAKWREPILLAAGVGASERILQVLLSLDSPDDPESNEACLAASAVAEVDIGIIPESSVMSLADRLRLRLGSPVPVIAIDAAEGLAGIAHLIPEFVASIAVGLWEHDQPWTRLGATCAGLCTGSASIPLEKVVEWVEQLEASPEFMGGRRSWRSHSHGLYELYKAALPRAVARMAKEMPPETAEKKIATFFSRPELSMGLSEAAKSGLTEEPYRGWAVRSISRIMSGISQWAGAFDEYDKAANAAYVIILNSILAACGRERDNTPANILEYRVIGDLFGPMGYWDLRQRQ